MFGLEWYAVRNTCTALDPGQFIILSLFFQKMKMYMHMSVRLQQILTTEVASKVTR